MENETWDELERLVRDAASAVGRMEVCLGRMSGILVAARSGELRAEWSAEDLRRLDAMEEAFGHGRVYGAGRPRCGDSEGGR